MLQAQLRQTYEHLIASGCDRRLLPGADGLNPYGASVTPRDAIALSSCTCSTPSTRAYDAAKTTLQRLQQASDPSAAIAMILSRVRDSIRTCLQLSQSVEIALTPSGTDVELLALALIAEPGDREIVNVIVGPREVGSGTLKAASACHYNTRLPRGGDAVVGEAVNRALASRVTIERVDVRDERGEILAPAEVDAVVTQIVVAALEREAQVILHLVAHSKTGIHAPSLGLLDNISRNMPHDVAIVVDAAQGRLEPTAYQDALDQGFLVSFTGSKYFGGPPFAGALLVPARFDPTVRGVHRLPDGFENYFSRNDMPESWSTLRASLDDWCNLGSVLRWSASAREMEAYFRIDAGTREKVAKAFDASVRFWFGDSSSAVTIADNFQFLYADSCLPSIESVPTVFSIEVVDSRGTPLNAAELLDMQRQLNTDGDSEQRETGSTAEKDAFHLGQPVMISEHRAVLRIALGASLLIDVASNPQIGSSLLSRIAWLHKRIGRLSERCNEIARADRPTVSTDS